MKKRFFCRLIVICMLLNLIPCINAGAASELASIELGAANVENGLSMLENTASYLVGTETRSSYGIKDGVSCKIIGSTSNSSDSYAYFKLTNEARKKISGDIYLMLDFYDYAPVRFWIEYGGTDGAYTKSEEYTSQGSSNWMQTIFKLSDVSFNGGQHYGSDFRLVIKYGLNYSLPIKSVSLCKTLIGNEKYTPFINIAMKDISGGIEADFPNVIFKGENTISLKNESISADITSAWGAGERNLMAIVKYYDNTSNFVIEYLKNGKWQESESIGGFNTGRYEKRVVSLQGICLADGEPELRIVKKNGTDPVYISGFLVREYDEKAKVENGTAIVESDSAELAELKTDAKKQIVQVNEKKYASYTSENNSFDFSINLDKQYIGENSNDLFIELQYGNETDAEIFAEYVNVKNEVVTGGSVSLKGSSEDLTQTFILKDAVCKNGLSDKSDVKFSITGERLDIRAIRIYKTAPVSKDYLFDSWNDLNNNGKIATSQNTHNWQFMKYTSGEGYAQLTLDNTIPSWMDNGSYPRMYIHGNERFVQEPSGKSDFVLAWTVTKNGTATVYSRPHMSTSQPGSDGVKAEIVYNGKTYSSRTISGTDAVGSEEILSIDVKKGENIYFRVNKNGTTAYDFTDWRPIILLEESESVGNSSKEAYISLGINSAGEGLKLKNEYSSIKLNSGNVVLTNDYSETPCIALKMDDDFRYRDSEVNPVYVEVTLQNNDGALVWCEYHGADGEIKRSASVGTTETNTGRNISFMLKDADFGSELPWHFKVCAKQQEGVKITKIKTTQVMPKSYILTYEAESDTYNGLKLQTSASKGVSLTGTDNRKVMCLSGNSASAYIDADNTYMYLNGQNKAYLMIEYFDNLCEFGVEYINSEGKKVQSEIVSGQNSLVWKNVVLVLTDPVFKNGQAGGSDFKIFANERDKLNIAKISLSSESFPEYYVGVDRGGDTDASGITIITGETPIEINGKKSVEISENGVGYDIDDKAFGKLNADGTIYNITVEYLDVPNAEFMLTYDSSKIKIFDAHNAETWHIKTGGSGKWKTANFPVSNAYFANGQPNKADFTIKKASGEEKLYVSDVSVRKGYGEMYDIATENCIPLVSSALYNADRIENPNFDLKYRLLAPSYKNYGNDKYIDGTCRYGTDYIELHMPTLKPQKICGVIIPGSYDDFFKVEALINGEWELICDGLYGGNMAASYRVATFEPIEATAVRVSGTAKYGYSAIGSKFRVFSPEPDSATYHSGTIDVTTQKDAYENEDIIFNVTYTSCDENEGNYTLKADIINNAGEVVRKDAFVESVPSNGEKNLTFTLSKNDELYSAGAYTIEAKVYKDNILLDRSTKLFGIKGVTKFVDLSSKQLSMSKRTLSLGTVGQFNYVTGTVIPKEIFEDLRDTGYDTIQVEIYLREIEPIRGVYDFTTLDKDIEYAMEAGLNVSIWLEFQDVMTSDWIPEEEQMRDQYGQKAPTRRPDIEGHFGDTCWPSAWSETFLAETEQCIRHICERYDGLTNIVSYGIGALSCEVFYPDDQETYDYSEPAQKAYREKYLQDELGLSLEDVNKRYGRNYSSWEEVRLQVPEADADGDFSSIAWADFKEFRGYTQTQFFKRNMRIFNEAAPAKPISMFGSLISSYDEYIVNLAKRNASSIVTNASNELAIVVPSLNFGGNTLNGWIHGEPGYIPATSGHEGNVGRAYFHTAEGGKATMNWQATALESGKARAEINGVSSTYKGVEQIKDLNRISEEVLNCNIAENDIAVIVGSSLTDGDLGVLGNSRNPPNAYTIDINRDGVEGSIYSFVQNSSVVSNVDYYQDFANDIFCTAEVLKKYKLVIQNNKPVLKSDVVNNMVEYVNNGGTLLLFSNSGMTDPTNSKPWELLKKLSGGKAIPGSEIITNSLEFRASNSPVFSSDKTLYIKNYRDISDWDWATTIAETNGTPIVKMWNYGSGKVIYCAGEIYPGDYGALGNAFLQCICDYVGIVPQAENGEVTKDGGDTYSIYKRVKTFGNDRYLLLFANNWSGNTFTKLKLNEVEPNTNYRVYFAHRDYDEYLQNTSGGEFLAKNITLPSAVTSILKYTTDRLFSAVGDFNRQESACWSYYKGDKKIENFDEEAQAYKDGDVIFKEQTTIPAESCSRVWTAPESGFVSIKGYATLTADGGNVDGKILLNGTEIESFTLTGKNRHRIYIAQNVNSGDKISFVLENKGDVLLAETDWNPQLALNTKATEISLGSNLSGSGTEKTWTATQKGRVVIAGNVSGNGVGRILNEDSGVFGQKINGSRKFYIDTDVKEGQTIHFVTETGEPLEWNGKLWLLK